MLCLTLLLRTACSRSMHSILQQPRCKFPREAGCLIHRRTCLVGARRPRIFWCCRGGPGLAGSGVGSSAGGGDCVPGARHQGDHQGGRQGRAARPAAHQEAVALSRHSSHPEPSQAGCSFDLTSVSNTCEAILLGSYVKGTSPLWALCAFSN